MRDEETQAPEQPAQSNSHPHGSPPADFPTHPDRNGSQRPCEFGLLRRLSEAEAELHEAKAKLNSIRYQLGSLIVDALRDPRHNLLRLPKELFRLRHNRFAIVEQETRTAEGKSREPREGPRLPQNVVLFVPTNGSGLGHLTRCLAIADQLRRLSPATRILFLTTSPALPILYAQGYLAYHIPPQNLGEHDSLKLRWDDLLEAVLEKVIEIHHPDSIVFDGAYPYPGLEKSLERHRELQWVWVKRGLYKNSDFVNKISPFYGLFDRILIPGEIYEDARESRVRQAVKVAPIIFQPKGPVLSRDDACRLLRLDAAKPIVYVQLGSGNINDIRALQQRVVETLNRSFPDVQVVLGESIITRDRFAITGTYVSLRDFPNSIYFSAFDAAVLAAGYNSVYEAVFYGLPTVFFPNAETKTDDQVKRANFAEREGYAKTMRDFDESEFTKTIARFLRSEPTRRKQAQIRNGALQAAELILECESS